MLLYRTPIIAKIKREIKKEKKMVRKKIENIRDQFSPMYISRKKINKILIDELKKDIDVIDNLKFKEKYRSDNDFKDN